MGNNIGRIMLDYQHGYELTKEDGAKILELITKEEKQNLDNWVQHMLDNCTNKIDYSEKKFLLTKKTLMKMVSCIAALHNRQVFSNAFLEDISAILENALSVSYTDRKLQINETRSYIQKNGICYARFKIDYESWTEGWIFSDVFVKFEISTNAILFDDAGQLAMSFLKTELENMLNNNNSLFAQTRKERLSAQIEKVLADNSDTNLYNPAKARQVASVCTII